MVKKKTKTIKKIRRRGDSWTEEDVKVHTGLPPQVQGQVRCYLKLSINQVLWMIPNAPDVTHVRVQWWGESSDGAVFRPVDVKKGNKGTCRTTAKFAIRSGPKQFAAYLNDMKSLVFEVLSGSQMVTVGRAQVDHIGSLAPTRPINGFFPVFSADDEKVAELQVAVVLESLMASYDSMSSVPTPDMSIEAFGAQNNDIMPPHQGVPVPFPRPTYSVSDDPFISPNAKRLSSRVTPHGVDNQLFGATQVLTGNAAQRQVYSVVKDSYQSYTSNDVASSDGQVPHHDKQRYHGLENPTSGSTSYPHTTSHGDSHPNAPQRNGARRSSLKNTLDSQASTLNGIGSIESDNAQSSGQERRPEKSVSYSKDAETSSGHTTDLVSVLLERGNKLKEAMIVSTIDNPTPDTNHQPSTGTDWGVYSPLKNRGSTGDLFRELLQHESPEKLTRGGMLEDIETRAVDLVMGNNVTNSQLRMLKAMNGSPGSSISGDEVDFLLSDPEDPLHDADVLEELFYKQAQIESEGSVDDGKDEDEELAFIMKKSHSNTSLASLEDPGNHRPASRSSTSSLLDREPVRERDVMKEKPHPSKHVSIPKRSGRSKTRDKPPTSKPKSKLTKDRSRSGSGGRGKSKGRSKSPKCIELDSDCDAMSISRMSEGSRVSFDPVPSDAEEPQKPVRLRRNSHPTPCDGLSVERLTVLGRVHKARVTVTDMVMQDEALSMQGTPTRGRGSRVHGGKPPRPPKPVKNCTYFVEYQFPVVATSRDKHQPNAMATEVMRVASKKVLDGAVSFNHRSMFPVMFNGDAIEKWWKSALVFKVYSKTSGQKVPRLLGMCSLSLQSVLKSDALWLEKNMDVKDRSPTGSSTNNSILSNRSASDSGDWPIVANIKVSVELASDHKDFPSALARVRLAEMTNPRVVAIPHSPTTRKAKKLSALASAPHTDGKGHTSGTQTEPQSLAVNRLPLSVPDAPPLQLAPPPQTFVYQGAQDMGGLESLTLHTLLLVHEGCAITLHGTPSQRHGEKTPSQPPQPSSGWSGRDLATRNLYLVCRMFWCDDVSRSNVVWGSCDPQFKFSQVAPMLLTASLLERLRNNFMIIEVWDKKTSADNDQLVGMVKLPLHQFYMSFRDRRVAGALLKSQYPVVSVDNELPIVNPFTGCQFGKLRVLLGMGSMEQVSSLQRLKMDGISAVSVPERPNNYLERHHVYSDGRTAQDYTGTHDNIVEHAFDVVVESIKGLRLLDNLIWGEADCFVQYHFPTQTHSKQEGGPRILHATPSLKTFRTATTLCVPDPVFNDVIRHKISLPEGTPVQKEILTACAGVGGGAGGVPFEIWCRHYHPNVRDQAIAKCSLPLAKLCAMVTMQKQGERNVQTFTLPLTSLVPDPDEPPPQHKAQMPQCGLLELTINYKTQITRSEPEMRADAMNRALPGATVCLALGITRASGLKVAADILARRDAGMQYASEVGVNTYIRVKLSFMQKEDERVTRTVARSFSPEFSHHMDFPCPLLWTEPGADALSLAELLENAEAVFELWHQVPTSFDADPQHVYTGSGQVSGRRLVSLAGDILMGTVTVPLVSLLSRKTGASGWYPVYLPSLAWDTDALDDPSQLSIHGNKGLERVVGGVELSIKFAHHEDLDRVVHAARGVGWSPEFDVEHRDWDSADELLDHYHQVAVSIDTVIFPVQNALITGLARLDPSGHCYVRYKLYDKGAVCSKLCTLSENDESYITVDLQHSKTLIVPGSSPFSWYLREERLELQVWVTYHIEEHSAARRPRNRDKLIGSAFLDLSSLADTRRRQHSISGIFPLFKPGASSLGGACVRAHVSLRPHTGNLPQSDEDEEVIVRSPQRKNKPKVADSPEEPTYQVDMEATFPVHISVERAMHLPHVQDNGSTHLPDTYASYQTADQTELTYTEVITATDTPLWNHKHDTRLDKELLMQSSRCLVFKLWHKPRGVSPVPDKSCDSVLGFVSVDLAPLTSGLHQLCGWYNVMDFHGSCQGQIKVAVTPIEPLIGIKPIKPLLYNQVSAAAPSFHTAAAYPTFPSHLARYTEQKISLTPSPDAAPESQQQQLTHFSQHFESVKKHHLQLNQRMTQMKTADASAASRSILFDHLRTNLSELDSMTAKFKQRLQPESFLVAMDTDQPLPHTHLVPPTSSDYPTINRANVTAVSFADDLVTSPREEDMSSTVPNTTTSTHAGFTTELLTTGVDPLSTLQTTTSTTSVNPQSTGTFAYADESHDLALESTGGSRVSRGAETSGEPTSDTFWQDEDEDQGLMSQGLFSTQQTNVSQPSQYSSAGGGKSENDLTLYSQTLHDAQNLLSAIHDAQRTYGQSGELGATGASATGVVGSYLGSIPSVGDLDMTAQSGPLPRSSRDSPTFTGEWQMQNDHDKSWEEEDTYSRAWAARHSDHGINGSDNEDEASMVVARPLNDISSANFGNNMDTQEVKEHEFGVQTGDSDLVEEFAQYGNESQNSNIDDLIEGNEEGEADDSSAGDAEEHPQITSPAQVLEDEGEHTDEVDGTDGDYSAENLSEASPRTEIMPGDETTIPHQGSRGRSQTSMRSSRKAAMFRREHIHQQGEQSSSEDDDVASHERTPRSQKHSSVTPSEDGSVHSHRSKPEEPHSSIWSAKTSSSSVSNRHRKRESVPQVVTVDLSQSDPESQGHSEKENSKPGIAAAVAHRESSRTVPPSVPNFFLPGADMEQSMRALRTTALPQPPTYQDAVHGKATTAKEHMEQVSDTSNLSSSLTHSILSAKHRPQPSAEQSKRIAKIFAQKFAKT